tara:strand:+ start:1930 stop:2229 length:300 start_codon:yes stop_codon:yes gene_type:complete
MLVWLFFYCDVSPSPLSKREKSTVFTIHFFVRSLFFTRHKGDNTLCRRKSLPPTNLLDVLEQERTSFCDDDDDDGERRRGNFGEVFGEDAPCREEEAKD